MDAGEPQVSSVTLAADASACVIVQATVPSTAQDGQYGNLNLVGNDGYYTDNNNWARAVATTQAALTAFKAASPSGNVGPGDTITYTISGSNTGGSAAYGIPVTVDGTSRTGILIEDVIPNGLTVSSMPTGSAGAGTVRFIYYNGTSWVTLTSSMLPITGDGTKKIGMLIEGTGAFFPQGAQYTFSFQAQVPSNAPAGTSYANTATVKFDANGDGDANDPGETVNTNSTTNTVAATYQPLVGYPGMVTLGNETQEVSSAYAGQVVSFTNVVKNGGNAPDSFTLSLQNSTFPAGTVCSIYAADGITPISGPVGPLAPGAEQNVVVKCQLPTNYYESPADGQTTTYQVELKATSVNDPSKWDITTDKLVDILPGYAVDLAAKGYSGDNDAGNDNPAAQTANPGQTVYFPLELTNTGANPDTYNLSGTVPSGWSVVFYPDTDCDGQPDGAPITNVGPVNPGQKVCFVAAVSVPQGATPGDNPVTFTATSTTAPGVYDQVTSTVSVNLVAQVTLEPDRQGTVTSPGTIQYTHTLLNNSNAPAYCDISGTGGAYGWTYQYSTDGTNWYSALGDVYVAPNGGTTTIYVRVIVPAGEPIGRVDVNTVTANCDVTTGTPDNNYEA
ncbi:MAG: NEW3 domain-containing protein, partial [Thermus sp.]